MFESIKKKIADKQQQKHEEALAQVQQAMNEGNLKEVIRLNKKIIKVDPDYADAWMNLGVAQAMDGKYAKAEETLKRAVELDPDNPHGWFNYSLSIYEQDRVAEALELMNKSLDMKPEDPFRHYVQRGGMFMDLGRMDEGFESLRKALELEPGEANVWYLLVSGLQQEQRRDESRAALDEALKLHGWDPGIRHLNARQLTLEGRSVEASEEFEQVLRLDPENPTAMLEKTLAMMDTDDPDDALPMMEMAMEHDDSIPHARMLFGLMKVRAGEIEEGVRIMDEALGETEELEEGAVPILARFYLHLRSATRATKPRDSKQYMRKALDLRKKLPADEWFEMVEDEIAALALSDEVDSAHQLILDTDQGKDRFSAAVAMVRSSLDPENAGFEKLTAEERSAVGQLLLKHAPVPLGDLDQDDDWEDDEDWEDDYVPPPDDGKEPPA